MRLGLLYTLLLMASPLASATYLIQDGVPIDNGHDSTQITVSTGAGLTINNSLAFDANGSPVIDGTGFDLQSQAGPPNCGLANQYANAFNLTFFSPINYTFAHVCSDGQPTTWHVTNLDHANLGATKWTVYGPAAGPLTISNSDTFTVDAGVTTLSISATGLIITGTQTTPDKVLITWTAPAGNVTGYTITRNGDCGQQYSLPPGTTSLLVALCTQNSTFTGRADFDVGPGANGNLIGPFRATPLGLGGGSSAFFGGNITTYAAQIGTTPAAVELAYAFLFVLLGAGTLGLAWTMLGGQFTTGAPYGALAGFAFSFALGFIPLWVTLLLLAAIVLYAVIKLRLARRDGG